LELGRNREVTALIYSGIPFTLAVVKARKIFFASLALAILALALRLGALGQFQDGYRILRETGLHEFPPEQAHRGAFLLYASLPLALASAVCVFASCRRREPAWPWVAIGFLGVYLLVSFAPA
jgi:hypothetical protein